MVGGDLPGLNFPHVAIDLWGVWEIRACVPQVLNTGNADGCQTEFAMLSNPGGKSQASKTRGNLISGLCWKTQLICLQTKPQRPDPQLVQTAVASLTSVGWILSWCKASGAPGIPAGRQCDLVGRALDWDSSDLGTIRTSVTSLLGDFGHVSSPPCASVSQSVSGG